MSEFGATYDLAVELVKKHNTFEKYFRGSILTEDQKEAFAFGIVNQAKYCEQLSPEIQKSFRLEDQVQRWYEQYVQLVVEFPNVIVTRTPASEIEVNCKKLFVIGRTRVIEDNYLRTCNSTFEHIHGNFSDTSKDDFAVVIYIPFLYGESGTGRYLGYFETVQTKF